MSTGLRSRRVKVRSLPATLWRRRTASDRSRSHELRWFIIRWQHGGYAQSAGHPSRKRTASAMRVRLPHPPHCRTRRDVEVQASSVVAVWSSVVQRRRACDPITRRFCLRLRRVGRVVMHRGANAESPLGMGGSIPPPSVERVQGESHGSLAQWQSTRSSPGRPRVQFPHGPLDSTVPPADEGTAVRKKRRASLDTGRWCRRYARRTEDPQGQVQLLIGPWFGTDAAVAQLGERRPRNAEVAGSTPARGSWMCDRCVAQRQSDGLISRRCWFESSRTHVV